LTVSSDSTFIAVAEVFGKSSPMKTKNNALMAIAATALIASSFSAPAMAQSHYDNASRTQCSGWKNQYRGYGGLAHIIRGGPFGAIFATASLNAGSAYGNANCQRF
jgi:uncharacterized protein (DUF1501 family)